MASIKFYTKFTASISWILFFVSGSTLKSRLFGQSPWSYTRQLQILMGPSYPVVSSCITWILYTHFDYL